MPSSNLPNRSHYHMSPKELEELRHQVEALFFNSHIEESLSLSAVIKKDESWRMCVDS